VVVYRGSPGLGFGAMMAGLISADASIASMLAKSTEAFIVVVV